MADPLRYYARFQSARGGWTSLPPWARQVVAFCALPGLALVALSILALGVSILALLLLTVPVYRLLQALTGTGVPTPAVDPVINPIFSTLFGGAPGDARAGRKQVDVRVVDRGPVSDGPTETD